MIRATPIANSPTACEPPTRRPIGRSAKSRNFSRRIPPKCCCRYMGLGTNTPPKNSVNGS